MKFAKAKVVTKGTYDELYPQKYDATRDVEGAPVPYLIQLIRQIF